MTVKTTEKIRYKRYRCKACGFEKMIDTNHYGECYSLGRLNHCPKCPPMEPTVWVCCEEPPEGMGKPAPWRQVKLGDICEIVEGC